MSDVACFRFIYIIPFVFTDESKNSLYQRDIYKDIANYMDSGKNKFIWKKTHDEFDMQESDIYACILNSFYTMPDCSKQDRANIGTSWEMHPQIGSDYGGIKVPRIVYHSLEASDYEIDIATIGLSVFQNDVGFLWFEINEENCDNKAINTSDLMFIQHSFKELNQKLGQKFSISYSGNTGDICESFTFGALFSEFLLKLSDNRIKYFAGRKSCLSDNGKTVPDKALMFSYAVFNYPDRSRNVVEDMQRTVYYLGRGLTAKYPFTNEKNLEQDIFSPFKDSMWYGSREGCGYFVPKSDYHVDKLYKRFILNYFPLYLLLLYQSYSLQYYSEKLSTLFAGDISDYLTNTEETVTKLEEFRTEYNTFLMKGVYASVAHLQNVNDYYVFMQKRLRIREDIQSISVGMEALADFSQEKTNRDLSKTIMMLSVLTVFSALADGTTFIKDFAGIDPLCANDLSIFYIVFFIIACITIYVLYKVIEWKSIKTFSKCFYEKIMKNILIYLFLPIICIYIIKIVGGLLK